MESTSGNGSTFTIYLPASHMEAPAERGASTAVHRGSETILVVDDQPLVLESTRQMLEALGYTVLAAQNGEEALGIYDRQGEAIALVVLDMIMPGLGGSATYNGLKELDPRVKVILSSGYSLDGEASQILDRGCNGFIQKPFDLSVLSGKIREILEG